MNVYKNDADASDVYPTTPVPDDGNYGSVSTDTNGNTVSAPPANTDQV